MNGWFRQSLHRVRSFFRSVQDDREFDAEMAAHLAFATEENLERGLPPSERQGALTSAIGVAFGIAVSLVLTRWMQSQFFDVSATDPLTYVAVAALLATVALLASYIPGRRAAAVDPAVALRYE